MNILETDVAIIGAGTAGLSAYRAVKAAGLNAVLVEGGPYGTTCARVGCMPSKLLIAAAEVAHSARHSVPFGVRIDHVGIDGVAVMERVRRERDRFVGFVLESVEAMPAEDRIRGYAKFVSDTEIDVDAHTRIRASRSIIATGSSPVVPRLYQGLGDRVVVNDDVFEWTDLPKRVAVVGAGVIGLELGQALARLGVQVTMLARSQKVGGLADPDVTESAVAAFEQEFSLYRQATVEAAKKVEGGVALSFKRHDGQTESREVDYVLVAAGRRPNIAALGLEHTSALLDERGMPDYDPETLQIRGTPLFIAGDVNAAHPILHEAADDGRIAGENAASYPNVQAQPRRAPLAIVFSDPQLARVGPTVDKLPRSCTVEGQVSFNNQGRSRVMLKNRGLLKVYAHADDGRLLGAEMAGPAMEHIAHLLAWSLQQGLTVQQMLDMPFYHPVVEEGLRTALRQALKAQAAHQLEDVKVAEEAVNSR